MPLPDFSTRNDPITARYRQELRAASRAVLYLHGDPDEAAEYQQLADYCREHGCAEDSYGRGGLLSRFQEELGELFGKPAALFMPSGTMAQQIALRIACDQRGGNTIGLHATSHLMFNEFRAFEALHGLQAVELGEETRPYTTADLDALAQKPQAIVLELPYRWLGGVLPDWSEVEALQNWCREHEVHLHLDGARIWESAPFYEKSLADIVAGFDSVYISFYKTLGAFAGAALLGSEDLVGEAFIWQRRHGGNLPRIDPLVASARMNLQQRLPRIGAYVERLQSLAAALTDIDGLQVVPAQPRTNMLHLHLDAEPYRLHLARDTLAEQEKIWLSGGFHPHPDGGSFMEVFVGDTLLALDDPTVKHWIQGFIDEARA